MRWAWFSAVLWAAVAVLSVQLVAGCRFDRGGLHGDARTTVKDQAVDGVAVADLSADQGSDAAGPASCCRTNTPPTPPIPPPGESGVCQAGGSFELRRHCFDKASCDGKSGECLLSGGGCITCTRSCKGACTLVLTESSRPAVLCCAGESANGDGWIGTSCNKGSECRTGLCASNGQCFVPCEQGECEKEGGTCAEVEVRFAARPLRYGNACVRMQDAGIDAGPKRD